MNEMKLIDQDGEWFVHTGAFRAADPESGHFFEPGVKYKIRETEWMKGQPTIVSTSIEEDVETRVVKTKPARLPKVDPVTSEPLPGEPPLGLNVTGDVKNQVDFAKRNKT